MDYQLQNQEKDSEEGRGVGCRNKVLVALIVLGLLILIGLLIFWFEGGDFNILADRANYLAKDPGQATSNFIQYGQIKGQSGRICGVVSNFSGEVISGAKIEILGERINWSTQTDSSGQYCIPPLQSEALKVLGETLVGNYRLKVTAQSYQPQIKRVTVNSGENKEANFSLTSIKEDLLPDVY